MAARREVELEEGRETVERAKTGSVTNDKAGWGSAGFLAPKGMLLTFCMQPCGLIW